MLKVDKLTNCIHGTPFPEPCDLCGPIVRAYNPSAVDHPAHYGGADDPYEAIKVIEAWELTFNTGNAAKYIRRAGKKGDAIEDLEKARKYLEFEINRLKRLKK